MSVEKNNIGFVYVYIEIQDTIWENVSIFSEVGGILNIMQKFISHFIVAISSKELGGIITSSESINFVQQLFDTNLEQRFPIWEDTQHLNLWLNSGIILLDIKECERG